ncbi:MAG: gliding motility-associated C-terminal domain-containing protein [Crocinitomicaceae bacterium]
MLRLLLLFVISLTGIPPLFAQYATTGDASVMASCNGFEITPGSSNQLGSMHATSTVDLTTNFSLLFKVKFGCDDFGGEGMAFVMQAGPWALGSGGYGLGYQGLSNALAVEFDTRDNQGSGQINNWDIGGDHISLMADGVIDHSSASCLTGLPLGPISTFTGDVEDCKTYLVEIEWTAGATQTITVNVDGGQSLTYTGDMINNNLGGTSMVTWGWTGATSAFSNQQTVEIALCPDFTFSATNCPGQLINFTDNTISQFPITQYDWDFDGTIVTNGGPTPSHTFATAGNHPVTLTVTDSQGCTTDTTINIGVGFLVDVNADDLTICPNGSTTLHVSGLPFVGNNCCFELHCYDIWDDGWGGTEVEVFVDGTSQGTYASPNLNTGNVHTEIYPFCWNHGSSIELVVNGTTGIQPQESSVFLVNASTGDTVTQILSDFLSGTTSWYDGASTSYTVDCGITPPAYTYQWDNAGFLSDDTSSDPVATIPSTTTFNVDVTDPNTSCVISESITINTYPPGDAVISGNQTVCQGDDGDLSISFTGPTPYDFTISGPGGPYNITGVNSTPYIFSSSLDGTYTITSFTSSGCTGTFSGSGDINVIIPPIVDIEANATYCDGDAISALTVVSSNGGTVNWYDNAALTPPVIATGNSFTPSPPIGTTTYYATETESILGCTGPSDQVTIIVNPIPPAPSWTGNTIYCEGDLPTPATATASLGGSITWYDAPPPATVLSTNNSYSPTLIVGTFDIYVTETANGCESPTSVISYTVKPTPTAPSVSGQLVYCEGDTPSPLTATPSLGGQIDWYNSLGIGLATGTTYTPALTVGSNDLWVYESLNGCTSDSTVVTIDVSAAPSVSVTPEISICRGDSVQVTAVHNGYDITWSNGMSGETVYLGPDSTTQYIVTATNPSCGFAEDSIYLIVNPLPDIVAGNDTLIGIGGEVELWASSDNNISYEWVPEVDECITDNCSEVYSVPDQATVYVVFATDKNGCVNTDSVFVDISGFMDVFVPNIFSPNGDGHNDFLEVKGPRLFNYSIEVYDRWGKKVFVSTEQKEYWDGTLNGKELTPQTFVYVIKGETVLGERIALQGNVSIIK